MLVSVKSRRLSETRRDLLSELSGRIGSVPKLVDLGIPNDIPVWLTSLLSLSMSPAVS